MEVKQQICLRNGVHDQNNLEANLLVSTIVIYLYHCNSLLAGYLYFHSSFLKAVVNLIPRMIFPICTNGWVSLALNKLGPHKSLIWSINFLPFFSLCFFLSAVCKTLYGLFSSPFGLYVSSSLSTCLFCLFPVSFLNIFQISP